MVAQLVMRTDEGRFRQSITKNVRILDNSNFFHPWWWVGGWVTIRIIMPLRGSILQVGTCQIFSLAENPRWSRVWQQTEKHYS